MSRLFERARIHLLELKNRFVRAATWTGLATDDGEATEALTFRLTALAEGGVGLIITGHTYVQPRGQASFRQLAIHDDRFVEKLEQMTQAVHRSGGKIALQLAHAGAFAFDTVPKPHFVVSPLPDKPPEEQRELSASNIAELVECFALAGARAKAAGFDAVEIHSAHGYLLSQFLSPFFNRRTDGYGGSIEGRARIHQEIIHAIRARVGEALPILIKMNGQDFIEGGLTAAEAAETAAMFERFGYNAIELSGGLLRSIKYSPSRMGINAEKKEAYFQNDARMVKQRIGIPLILVGGIRSFHVAEALVDTGAAEFIAMSRPLICEPDLISRWASLDSRPSVCKSDNRCFKPGFEGQGVYCPHRA